MPDCDGIPQALCTVDLGGDLASGAYWFDPACGGGIGLRLLWDDVDEQWELDTDLMPFEITPITGDPTTRPINATLTYTSTAPGGVIVEIRYADGAEELLAKYENKVLWQPHRDLRMKLVDYDLTATAFRWKRYEWLSPAVDLREYSDVHGFDCGCMSSSTTAAVLIGILSIENNLPVDAPEEECAATPPVVIASLCADIEGTWVFEAGHWDVDADVHGTYPGTPTACFGGYGHIRNDEQLIQWFVNTSGTTGFTVVAGGSSPEARVDWSINLNISPCAFWLSGETYDLEWTPPADICMYCRGEDATATFTPLAVNLTTWLPQNRSDLPGCLPINICRGEPLYRMQIKCEGTDSSIYEWVLYSSTCRGNCESDTCQNTPPSVLPTEPVSNEDALDLGYTALVENGTLVAGTCECAAEPSTTCEGGCSVSTIKTEECDGPGDKKVYYWQNKNSLCTTECEAEGPCTWTVPFDIPETPLTDAEADLVILPDGNSLLDSVDKDFVGGCGCVPAYVRPECPECDCSELTGNASFTVTGAGYPHDGDYTLIKGDCNFVASGIDPTDCCWRGTNPDLMQIAELWWDPLAAKWKLLWDSGAYYESAGTACDTLITMSLISGGAGIYPATLAVTITP